MAIFFKSVFLSSAMQLSYIFGLYFVCGIILSKLQFVIQSIYRRRFGWYGILWTAWIGTPIHELSHIFFCALFHHKIESVSFFKPNAKTGGLGYINHSFNPSSLVQRIGNFFIGIGPLLFGSVMLLTIAYLLIPNGREIFLPLSSNNITWNDWTVSVGSTIRSLFSLANIQNYKFWLFLYIAFCISSHMAPSAEDRSGMWNGFIYIAGLILLSNFVFTAINIDITKAVYSMSQGGGVLLALFLFAIIISILHLAFISIIDRLLTKK